MRFAIGLTILAWFAQESHAQRLPSENLLVFRGPDGKPAPVRTLGDWANRRLEIVAGMDAIMGRMPGAEKRCDLDVRTESEVDCGVYVRRLISFASEPNSRVPAYLLIPKNVLEANGGTAPAVLALHPTDQSVGHGVIVGLGRTSYPAYANELAQRGFVVLAPSYPQLAKYQPDLKELGWESGTLKAVWDNIRGLDLLDSLPYVKHGTYGAIGHSLGGHNALFTAVRDDRITVVVTSCGFDRFADYYQGNKDVWKPGAGWTQGRYMPRLAEYRGRLDAIPFDFPELIAAIAPRVVFVVAPSKDSNFRAESVDRAIKAARPVFELFGSTTNLRIEHPDCEHDFPKEARDAAYRLLEAELK